MANFLQTLIPLLSSIALLLALASMQMPARGDDIPDQTQFYYDFNGPHPPKLILQGDAHYPTDTTYLRLTKTDDSGKALTNSYGRALYSDPIKFWDEEGQVDLETTIGFIIKNNTGDIDPADGIAFFIAPVDPPIGAAGGRFGIFDANGKAPNTFAVEFDTYINTWDPKYRHIGIDIESQVSSADKPIDGPIFGQEATARINYEEARKAISVHLTIGTKTYESNYECDLKTILPQHVQVGIAASTGANVAIHDITKWYYNSEIVRTGNNIRQYV